MSSWSVHQRQICRGEEVAQTTETHLAGIFSKLKDKRGRYVVTDPQTQHYPSYRNDSQSNAVE